MIRIRMDKEQNVEDHAIFLMKEYDKKNRLPKVSAVHRALEPEVCDECRETYWKRIDTWDGHYPCPGSPDKKSTGF